MATDTEKTLQIVQAQVVVHMTFSTDQGQGRPPQHDERQQLETQIHYSTSPTYVKLLSFLSWKKDLIRSP